MDGLPDGGIPGILAELRERVEPVPPLRFGIIGMGNMGHEHLRFLQILENEGVAVIRAVADPTPEQLTAAAEAAPKAAAHTDYKDLLAMDDVDAVIIASPNHTHIDVMEAAVVAVPPKH